MKLNISGCMSCIGIIGVICVYLLMNACVRMVMDPADTGSGQSPEQQWTELTSEDLSRHNRAVALMGQFAYGEAYQAFSDLSVRYPRLADLRVNQAISLYNRQLKGDEQIALDILRDVLEVDPNHVRALYSTGLLELYRGRPEIAAEHLLKVFKMDETDEAVCYFLGQCAAQREQYVEALTWYQKAIERDPWLSSAWYGLFTATQRSGDKDTSRQFMQKFQELKTNPRGHLLQFKYTKMGDKALVQTLDRVSTARSDTDCTLSGDLFDHGEALTITGGVMAMSEGVSMKSSPEDTETLAWRTVGRDVEMPFPGSITVCDINGDGLMDLFLADVFHERHAERNAVLIRKPEHGVRFQLDRSHPLVRVSRVRTCLWGDYDNDGLTDVYLCRTGENQLWRQEAKGQWRDVTTETGTAAGDLDTVDGAFVDADHDGDLDIVVINRDGPDDLLNNNLDGTFLSIGPKVGMRDTGISTGVVVTDLDGDADYDIMVLKRGQRPDVFLNNLAWEYAADATFERMWNADCLAVLPADIDADGANELYVLEHNGTLHEWDRSGGLWNGRIIHQYRVQDRHNPRDAFGLWIADITGDGRLEILLVTRHGMDVIGGGDEFRLLFSIQFPADHDLQAWAPAVLDVATGPSIVTWSSGQLPIVHNPGPGRGRFATLVLSGMENRSESMRSNASGVGTRVAARTGSRWTIVESGRSHTGPGQSLQPLTIGAGCAVTIDFISIDWSDGVYQTELSVPTGTLTTVTETQRQLSSCPVLFARDGQRYNFISDILGVGGIGYATAPGVYSEPRPWERLLIPEGNCVSVDGRFLFVMAEPMEEVTYLDTTSLSSWDIPPGWSMTIDERMAINGPAPTGEPLFFRNDHVPIQVINDRREDVTATISRRDSIAAPVGPIDSRFIGRLRRDHVLTLTFGQDLSRVALPLWLHAVGWVEYAYSQTNIAAFQAGADYRAATLEALNRDGSWQVVLDQFGYPAGMPREMTMPLPVLPEGCTMLRLSTNQEIYWDRLSLIEVEPCPDAVAMVFPLSTARLELCGFPKRLTHSQKRPDYDFSIRTATWNTRFLEGWYTQIGQCFDLLESRDDAVAIFGAGECLYLEFAADLPPLEDGWKRMFCLDVVGWCKDRDRYTKDGTTIEPLPYAAPRSERAQRLHDTFNTRYLAGQE